MQSATETRFISVFALLLVLLSYTVAAAAPNLQLIAEIPIPNWVVTANPTPPPPRLTNASFDLLSFDPVRQIMYSADRPNHGVTVINTQTNTVVGFIPITDPNAITANKTCVNGLGS